MKTLVGGAIASILGIIGLAVWWKAFLQLLAGALPIMVLLGGCLALYLGFDELKDTWKKEETTAETTPETPGESEDVEKYKKEIEDLKKELNSLKQSSS